MYSNYRYLKDSNDDSFDSVVLELQQHVDRVLPAACKDIAADNGELTLAALQVCVIGPHEDIYMLQAKPTNGSNQELLL